MTVFFRNIAVSGAVAVFTAAALGAGFTGSAYSAEQKPAEHVIEIKNFKFVEPKLRVRVGDKITWINRDIAPHTATATDKSWDSGSVRRNKFKTLIVTEGMAGPYFCRFHPSMKAQLEVLPASSPN